MRDSSIEHKSNATVGRGAYCFHWFDPRRRRVRALRARDGLPPAALGELAGSPHARGVRPCARRTARRRRSRNSSDEGRDACRGSRDPSAQPEGNAKPRWKQYAQPRARAGNTRRRSPLSSSSAVPNLSPRSAGESATARPVCVHSHAQAREAVARLEATPCAFASCASVPRAHARAATVVTPLDDGIVGGAAADAVPRSAHAVPAGS
jgi:hypothetical protein